MTITMSGNNTRLVYVCSPLRGDMEANIRSARHYCAYVAKECRAIPSAPHIYFTQFLDDDIAEERDFGLKAGIRLLSECEELWVFGDTISPGMRSEIRYANEHGIPVRHIPPGQYEEYLQERTMTYEML